MALKEIVMYPDPRLMQVCEPVGDDLTGIAQLVEDMAEVMFAANGAGLAAPQIGVLKRVFLIDPVVAGLGEKDAPLALIDPTITELSDETEVADEGCLSFPGVYVPIRRAYTAKARYKGLDGSTYEVIGSALFARALQHEADHLDGRLLTDHVGRIKRQMIRRKMEREGTTGATQ